MARSATAVLAAALGVLLAAAPAAAKRPRPNDVPPTSVIATLAPNRLQIYNNYDAPESVLGTSEVVVHYVTVGVNAPPLNDDNRDGIPDYVRRIGDAADNALAYFRARSFAAVVPDTGGPDVRPDVYISRFTPGILGVAFNADEAEGGGFVVLANQLDPSADVSFGSLWGTTAHELFHLVQFATGGTWPTWVGEGTAAAVESRVFPQLADIVNRLQFDRWLQHPEQPLSSGVYGSQLFWRYLDERVPALLPRLFAERSTRIRPAATLRRVYEELAHRPFATAFVDFAASMADRWHDRLGYRTAPRGRVAPLAVHFLRLRRRVVEVRVPPAGIEAAVSYDCESANPGGPEERGRVAPQRRGSVVRFEIPRRPCRGSQRFTNPILAVANGRIDRALEYAVLDRR